jgi:hypothetical protein
VSDRRQARCNRIGHRFARAGITRRWQSLLWSCCAFVDRHFLFIRIDKWYVHRETRRDETRPDQTRRVHPIDTNRCDMTRCEQCVFCHSYRELQTTVLVQSNHQRAIQRQVPHQSHLLQHKVMTTIWHLIMRSIAMRQQLLQSAEWYSIYCFYLQQGTTNHARARSLTLCLSCSLWLQQTDRY